MGAKFAKNPDWVRARAAAQTIVGICDNARHIAPENTTMLQAYRNQVCAQLEEIAAALIITAVNP